MFEKILKEDVLNPNSDETTKKRNGKRNRPVEVIEEVSKVPQRKKVVVTDEMKFHDVDVEHWRVSQTVQWLKQIDLSHLSTLFSSMNGLMLMSCTWCSSAVFERIQSSHSLIITIVSLKYTVPRLHHRPTRTGTQVHQRA